MRVPQATSLTHVSDSLQAGQFGFKIYIIILCYKFLQPRRSVFTAAVAATVSLHEPKDKVGFIEVLSVEHVNLSTFYATLQLSIYPALSTDTILVDSPSELERQIGKARRRAQSVYSDTHAQVQGWVSKWIGVEHAVESELRNNRVKSSS